MAKKKKKPTARKVAPKSRLNPETVSKALEALSSIGKQVKERMQDPEVQAKLKEKLASISADDGKQAMNNPGPIVELPSVQGNLSFPDKTIPRRDRIQWYWQCGKSTVMASYIKEDSCYTEEVLQAKPGARKGDFVIDVIGYNGSALFNQSVEEAKVVAEAILSALGWEHEWPKYYVDPGYMTEGGEMAEIPHDDPGPAVTFTPSEPYDELPRIQTGLPIPGIDDPPKTEAEFLGNEEEFHPNPDVHKCCGHCDQDKDIHAPHTMGCPTELDDE